jgi:hypothetical protein
MHICLCTVTLSVVRLMTCGPCLIFCAIWKIWFYHLIPKLRLGRLLYDIDSEYLNVNFKLCCFSILAGLLIPCMLYIMTYYKLQPTYYISNVLSGIYSIYSMNVYDDLFVWRTFSKIYCNGVSDHPFQLMFFKWYFTQFSAHRLCKNNV